MMRSSRQQFRLGVLLCFLAMPFLHAQTETPLLPPSPSVKDIQADPQTCPPEITSEGLSLPIDFPASHARQFWDIPIPRIPSDATAITLILSCQDLAPIRGLTVHLRSGNGWYTASANLNEGLRKRIHLPRSLFQPEDAPGPWEKSRVLRVSVWSQTAGRSRITLHAVNAYVDTIAIVRPSAPGSDAYVASVTRLFEKAGVPFTLIGESEENLKPYRLLVLPNAADIPARVSDRLSAFVKRGGRLIVFFSASKPLGTLLGVRPGAWQSADSEGWSSMLFSSDISGRPLRIPHVTNGMIPPSAGSESLHAKVVATWVDGLGKVTRLPACVLTDRGAWFAHVPPLAYPDAVTLTRKLVTSFVPNLSLPPPDAGLPEGFKLPPSAMTNEIRAAWHSASIPSHPRGWDGMMQILSQQGINTLLLRWRPSMQGSFHMAAAAGDKAGVAVHAWFTCWVSDAAPSGKAISSGSLMRDASGNTLQWLCPSIPENRAMLLDTLRGIARRGVAGIHLDYIRYPGEMGCYAPATRRAFESVLGSPVAAWPADVLAGGKHADAFQAFRRNTLTSFVREAREAVRAINPAIKLSAAVFPTPETAVPMGQDWPAWIREGLLDFVSPMIYTENTTQFAASLDACLATVPATALVPGLGTGADTSQLDAPTAAQQIAQVRTRRLAGFSFFAVDDTLLSTILPELSLK